jgi:hypothetical protein
MLFNTAAAAYPVNIFYACNSPYCLIHCFYEKTVLAVFYKFGHATPVKGDYRSAAGHGLDNGQAERLIEIYGMQKRACLAKQPVALNRPGAADINRIVVVQVRFDVLVIVGFILDDSRQYQLFIASPGNFNGLSGTLVMVNAPEKEQIIVRFRLKIKLLYIYAVMDGFDIVQIRRPVGIADGNIEHLAVVFLVNRQIPGDEKP